MQQDSSPTSAVTALTIHRPWSGLIACGAKSCETRSWPAPTSLIGRRLAIHASKAAIPQNLDAATTAAMEAALGLPAPKWSDLPGGVVVAVATLAGAYQVAALIPKFDRVSINNMVPGSQPRTTLDLFPGEWRFGDYNTGRWLWVLADIVPLKSPAPARGHQRLWRWQPQLTRATSNHL